MVTTPARSGETTESEKNASAPEVPLPKTKKTTRVLYAVQECLAQVDNRGDGDEAEGIGMAMCSIVPVAVERRIEWLGPTCS